MTFISSLASFYLISFLVGWYLSGGLFRNFSNITVCGSISLGFHPIVYSVLCVV